MAAPAREVTVSLLARRWLRRRRSIRATRTNPRQISGAVTAHRHWPVKDSAGQGSPPLEGARGRIFLPRYHETLEQSVRRPAGRVHTGERVV
jgi:hypothetical protein